MSKQHNRFIAALMMAMPELSKESKQFWIERPEQLKQLMDGLAHPDLRSLMETVIPIRLPTTTEDIQSYFFKEPRIKLSEDLDNTISLWEPYTAPGGRAVRYTMSKKAATNAAFRRDLPQVQVFDMGLHDVLTIVVGLFKNHFAFGGAIGLMPESFNILYFRESDKEFTLVIEPDDTNWKVSVEDYAAERATEKIWGWPPTTRIFIPAAAE